MMTWPPLPNLSPHAIFEPSHLIFEPSQPRFRAPQPFFNRITPIFHASSPTPAPTAVRPPTQPVPSRSRRSSSSSSRGSRCRCFFIALNHGAFFFSQFTPVPERTYDYSYVRSTNFFFVIVSIVIESHSFSGPKRVVWAPGHVFYV